MYAFYRKPKPEQTERLALRMGDWTDEEMVSKMAGMVPAGIEVADGEAAHRFMKIFTERPG